MSSQNQSSFYSGNKYCDHAQMIDQKAVWKASWQRKNKLYFGAGRKLRENKMLLGKSKKQVNI